MQKTKKRKNLEQKLLRKKKNKTYKASKIA